MPLIQRNRKFRVWDVGVLSHPRDKSVFKSTEWFWNCQYLFGILNILTRSLIVSYSSKNRQIKYASKKSDSWQEFLFCIYKKLNVEVSSIDTLNISRWIVAWCQPIAIPTPYAKLYYLVEASVYAPKYVHKSFDSELMSFKSVYPWWIYASCGYGYTKTIRCTCVSECVGLFLVLVSLCLQCSLCSMVLWYIEIDNGLKPTPNW